MPDKQESTEAKARLYSLYLRPWTLDVRIATGEVPHVTKLDDASRCLQLGGTTTGESSGGSTLEGKTSSEKTQGRKRLRGKQSVCVTPAVRSYATTWSWYVRGHVVSEHAAKIIKQFMAACCGKSSKTDDAVDGDDDKHEKPREIPGNQLPLGRVHAILDRMSSAKPDSRKRTPEDNEGAEQPHAKETDEEDVDQEALKQSDAIRDAMQTTARLWSRTAKPWPEEALDRSTSTIVEAMEKQVRRREKKSKEKKTYKAKDFQARAYMAWKEADVQSWLTHLTQEEEPPNDKQMEFIRRVANRCREECRSFKAPHAKEYSDEPLRDCLLGLPGAGKSTCIKYARRFFEECLQWEDGVQFQFLASQNTMAALIGGATIHTWGTIPVNATDASNKVQTKHADGDVDDLFLKALSIRFLIIDEVSTASPMLLGLLDAYLRRACCRHPYAKQGRRKRPFGGINVIFAGDFWQLPPVRANAIFANPFKRGCYGAEEQKIFKMFWNPKDEDSIQKTFLLTEPMRTRDPWLKTVLEADRTGSESWEMYCFMHGFPTRNPGSWLPGSPQPLCGNSTCATLAENEWPEMWRRGRGTWDNWLLRRERECAICKTERERRCCVLRPNNEADVERYTSEPFTGAPYVHPFRHPSYHATQLRAILFAKSSKRQLLWVTAYDKVLTNNVATSKEKEELRKERWLEFHDRFTAGIPGLLPLVRDLPVRFTESVDRVSREMGVFKHCRGILREWQLSETEIERLKDLEDPEVVLYQRPTKLFIEVDTGTKLMPMVAGKKIYTLKVQARQWTLDKGGAVKIQRFGFPIVPDFGGTAHAYCGSTLTAALGDLLPWWRKPRLEDMLKGYIIKSRVKEAQQLFLAQPYNPHLFRQGLLPGPQLLLDVLLEQKTMEEASKAWKQHEADKKSKGSTGRGIFRISIVP